MNTRISTLAIICTLGISMSAFAAPSVRTLGGASTYSSAASAAGGSSVTTAPKASGNSSVTTGSGESLRGGAMRVNTGSTIGSVRASSSRAASAPRLSIGKYLTTSQTVTGGGGDDTDPDPYNPPTPNQCPSKDCLGDIYQFIENLEQQIQNIQNEFNTYVDKEYVFSYNENTGKLIVTDTTNNEVVLEAKLVTYSDLQALEDDLNAYIERKHNEAMAEIARKQDILTPENLKGAGNVEIGFNNGVITVTGSGAENAQEKLVPGTAISINDNTNVISVNVGEGLYVDTSTNTLNASVSEGAIYTGDTGITVDNVAHKIAVALTGGNGIKVDGATISMDTPSISGNYFYSVDTAGSGVWSPFAVVDASALPQSISGDEIIQ